MLDLSREKGKDNVQVDELESPTSFADVVEGGCKPHYRNIAALETSLFVSLSCDDMNARVAHSVCAN